MSCQLNRCNMTLGTAPVYEYLEVFGDYGCVSKGDVVFKDATGRIVLTAFPDVYKEPDSELLSTPCRLLSKGESFTIKVEE